LSKSVLVVDDNSLIRRAVSRMLEAESFTVCGEAVDGRDAIDKAMQLQPDLIVLELAMPVMNGLQAAEILHQIMPSVPMILFSMHAGSVLQSQAEVAGIRAILPKDAGGNLLIAHAKSLLGLAQS
jgi:DNA-binding NarL/FixJ family response regulator